MNAALRRHYNAIQQLARDEWPPDKPLAEGTRDDLHNAAEDASR